MNVFMYVYLSCKWRNVYDRSRTSETSFGKPTERRNWTEEISGVTLPQITICLLQPPLVRNIRQDVDLVLQSVPHCH